jgi:hypothetical protein
MATIPDSNLPGHTMLHDRVVAALDSCHESRDIEFKRSAPWQDLQEHITKTSMAMSNLRDGGIIVVGVGEGDPAPTLDGIQPEHLATFDDGNVNDWVNKYASPAIRLALVRVTHASLEFLAIRISEFDATP